MPVLRVADPDEAPPPLSKKLDDLAEEMWNEGDKDERGKSSVANRFEKQFEGLMGRHAQWTLVGSLLRDGKLQKAYDRIQEFVTLLRRAEALEKERMDARIREEQERLDAERRQRQAEAEARGALISAEVSKGTWTQLDLLSWSNERIAEAS